MELPRDVNILEIRYSVTVTYVEIYNERVFDLLAVGGKGSQGQAAFSSTSAPADEMGNQGRGEHYRAGTAVITQANVAAARERIITPLQPDKSPLRSPPRA